jgi:hypothetical protein
MVLLVAAQAFAGTVSLTVTKKAGTGSERWAYVKYTSDPTKPDANVSGFGLKVYTADPNANAKITAIGDYIVGESNSTTKGYGIFPGGIIINDSNGTVTDWNTPIAPSWDPCAMGTGLDTNTIIVELGALYQEGNAPPLSGTLFSVKVDGDCNVCVTGEPLRGNVVLTDSNGAILSPMPPICFRITGEPEDLDFGDANDPTYPTLRASNGARHIPTGVTLGANRDTETEGQPSVKCDGDNKNGTVAYPPGDENGVQFAGGNAVTIIVSQACKLNAWVDFNNDGSFATAGDQIFTNNALTAGENYRVFTVPATVAYNTYLISRWRVDANGGLSYTGLAPDGEVEDYNMPFVSSCYEPCDPCYAEWVLVGRPICWCYPRQCHGDADGKKGGSALAGYTYVDSNDLNVLGAAWQIKDPTKGLGVAGRVTGRGIPFACADFNRKRGGSALAGYMRSDSADLNILGAYWLKKEVPKGSGVDPNCNPGNVIPGMPGTPP